MNGGFGNCWWRLFGENNEPPRHQGTKEMNYTDVITLVALIFCVALSFLFSGMESGVLALNRFRIRHLMRSGNKRAAVLNHYLDNPEDFLWTILVGNTVANIAIFTIGVLQLFYWLGGYRVWWTVAFIGF